MKPTDFRKQCLDIIEPFYPDASTWLDKNWPLVVEAVKKHTGRGILAALTNCVNKQPTRGKLDFFFADLATYLPREDVGAGLVEKETEQEYFSRQGLPVPPRSIHKETERWRKEAEAERPEGEKALAELKKKWGRVEVK